MLHVVLQSARVRDGLAGSWPLAERRQARTVQLDGALDDAGDLRDPVISGAHLPESARPQFAEPDLTATRKEARCGGEVAVDAQPVPADADFVVGTGPHHLQGDVVVLVEPYADPRQRLTLLVGPFPGSSPLRLDGERPVTTPVVRSG